MKRYLVTGQVTISMHCEVLAKSKADAMRAARDEASMMNLCHQCAGGAEGELEWRTSGEFDGEVSKLKAEDA